MLAQRASLHLNCKLRFCQLFFTTSYSGEVTAIKVRKNDSEVSRHYDL